MASCHGLLGPRTLPRRGQSKAPAQSTSSAKGGGILLCGHVGQGQGTQTRVRYGGVDKGGPQPKSGQVAKGNRIRDGAGPDLLRPCR